MAKKKKSHFVCQKCGAIQARWEGRCADCDTWGSLVEEMMAEAELPDKLKNHELKTSNHQRSKTSFASLDQNILDLKMWRYQTDLKEFDRVLGGGLVAGSFLLIGGEPGIGKSTLLMQYAGALAKKEVDVLYISGEESISQTAARAKRLGIFAKKIQVGSENNLAKILAAAREKCPQVLIIDSIQTLFFPELNSAPGSLTQIRECTGYLMTFSKSQNIAVIIVGHVTKDGSIAGPKSLEHMVDTVLSFEGDVNYGHRLLRAHKNRFGATYELGIFQMEGAGLKEITNPSQMFLGSKAQGATGAAIFASVEGSRPLLCEIQSLSSKTNMNLPRRTAVGIDLNRLILLLAVIGRHLKVHFSDSDVFVNVVGGLKVSETAIDLPLVAGLLSTYMNIVIPPTVVLFGEVGLTGEVRSISFPDLRIREGKKLGLKFFVIPASSKDAIAELEIPSDDIFYIKHLKELPDILKSLG